MDDTSESRETPKVVLAFGSAFSRWLLPMYEPLCRESYLRILSTDSHDRPDLVTQVDTGRQRLSALPSPFQKAISIGLDSFVPSWDRISGLEGYVKGSRIVNTVELHSGISLQVARLKRRYRFKHVVTVWENIAGRLRRNPIAARTIESVVASADHCIAISERARTALLLAGVASDRISVISPGMTLPEPPVRSSKPGIFKMLFVGKKVRSKGVEELLYALRLLKSDPELSHIDYRLTLLGIASSNWYCGKLTKRYGLSDSITEIPFVPHSEVFRFYHEADALVVPSRVTPLWQEQWGMVFMEAMSHGLPIVTTDSGSISEVVSGAALLARPNDHHSLYLCLKRLSTDPDLATQLSKQGARLALHRFDANEVAHKLRNVYETLL